MDSDTLALGYLLGIDTCGPLGSVALGRLTGADGVEMLAQTELEGRTYSATLLSAVSRLLEGRGIGLGAIGSIVVVHGPGSFTGVRVGLSAVKGLAEPGGIPVVAVSRLEVLATKAAVGSSALDAHRQEVFLRLDRGDNTPGQGVGEVLAGESELRELAAPASVAVCDDDAAAVLSAAWSDATLIRVTPPTAADALAVAAPAIRSGEFVDLVLLDGHYLRRSDAEIFGPQPLRTG